MLMIRLVARRCQGRSAEGGGQGCGCQYQPYGRAGYCRCGGEVLRRSPVEKGEKFHSRDRWYSRFCASAQVRKGEFPHMREIDACHQCFEIWAEC